MMNLALLRRIFGRRDDSGAGANLWVPPGHFYSPLPSIEEVKQREEQIFAAPPATIPGVELNIEEQLTFLEAFKGYYREQPFPAQKKDDRRYYFDNAYYSYADAICLYSMIRHVKPRRIIEIGSGYSSAAMLDTNEVFFSNSIACTFIDPYPERVSAVLRESDRTRVEIICRKAQDVPAETFAALESGDILFVDSSHVSKVNSDVNYVFFSILPTLKAGVFIHFHDVFDGFEYPKKWIYEGRAWNEAYVLRAFLQYNRHFKIVFFTTFLERCYRSEFATHMPLCLENPGGSIWICKI
jgi:predicted O-methyltransferase YrrM